MAIWASGGGRRGEESTRYSASRNQRGKKEKKKRDMRRRSCRERLKIKNAGQVQVVDQVGSRAGVAEASGKPQRAWQKAP